jgi:hypothetical protein
LRTGNLKATEEIRTRDSLIASAITRRLLQISSEPALKQQDALNLNKVISAQVHKVKEIENHHPQVFDLGGQTIMADLKVINQVEMRFRLDHNPVIKSKAREDIVKNLSGVALSHNGKYLWLGTDEFSAIERRTKIEGTEDTFSEHQRFYCKDFISNFDESKGEVDVEGLDYHDGYLWIIGSHSSKRKKVKIETNRFRLEEGELKGIKREENRYLLARIPVNGAGELEKDSPKRAWLKRRGNSDALTQALAEDEYLDLAKITENTDGTSLPGKEFYFYLPSKENGFDIEGLAARGNKVFIGLRGPVLRGIAILLEIEVKEGLSNELTLEPIGINNRLYKRHFLDLGGLGVRELCWDESDESLLVLAGPTMDLDGSHSLFRLNKPLSLEDNSISSQQNHQLEYLGDIPHCHHGDRAEGLTLYGDTNSILVVYDSPEEKERGKIRLIKDDQGNLIGVNADIFSLLRSSVNTI